MKKHLLLKGPNISIPICMSTEIGKVAVFNRDKATCEECLAALEKLFQVQSYEEAALLVKKEGWANLEEHNTSEETVAEAILGDKSTFWANIQRLER